MSPTLPCYAPCALNDAITALIRLLFIGGDAFPRRFFLNKAGNEVREAAQLLLSQ